jgi:hypothetical protein
MYSKAIENLYVDEDLSFPLWRGRKGEENTKIPSFYNPPMTQQ